MADADILDRQQENRDKTGVALSSLLAASVLTLLKLIVGLATNSLGILSEAAHSALDLLAAGVTLFAVRVSGRPASREYTYGRGKFENLSALFETLLLLVTCLWIVYKASNACTSSTARKSPSTAGRLRSWCCPMAVDFSRSRASATMPASTIARPWRPTPCTSPPTSGLRRWCCWGWRAWAAGRWNMPWLTNADTVAALGVAVIIVGVSLRLGKKSLDDLLDRIPVDLQERVTQAAAQVAGVLQVTKVRIAVQRPGNLRRRDPLGRTCHQFREGP